jgi:hypothetical protein
MRPLLLRGIGVSEMTAGASQYGNGMGGGRIPVGAMAKGAVIRTLILFSSFSALPDK